MTPTPRETLAGIDAALRLALGDASAANAFDASRRGFWNSFAVIWMFAPFWLWITLKQPAQIAELAAKQNQSVDLPDPFLFILTESIFYVMTWLLFPVVMIPVCRKLGASARYIRFIVARNWATLVMLLALTVPIELLYSAKIIEFGTHQTLFLLSFVLQNMYLWFVAWVVLRINAGLAVLVVALDVFLVAFTSLLKYFLYAS